MSYFEQTNVGHDEKDGQVGRPGFEPGTYAVSELGSSIESCCPNQARRPALFWYGVAKMGL